MIYIIIALALIALALAGLCVWLYHSLKQERNEKWDEISRNVELEKDVAFWREVNAEKIRDVLLYHAECKKLAAERNELQDKYSALKCGTNGHFYKDGVCTKCGRAQEARNELDL